MYILKEGIEIKINKSLAGRIIGITQATMSRIMNRKVACRKVVAYCITKYINQNAEIEDYFDKVEE